MLVVLWIPWGKCGRSGDDHRKSADNPVTSEIGLDLGCAVDNGGVANGGIDTSAPQTFTITVIL